MATLQEVSLIELSLPAIAKAQQTCPYVKQHRQGYAPRNTVLKYVLIAGTLLYCEVSDPSNPCPFLLSSKRSLVLNLVHHLDHPGIRKTTRRAALDYYWPSMRKNIKEFCRACHSCQAGKQSQTDDPSKLRMTGSRTSYIHVDVLGPLPDSYGYKYLFAAFCRTSRWLEVLPMRSASSEECSSAFLQWVSRYGLPITAVSDNGNSFVANLCQDILNTFNVRVKFSPAPANQSSCQWRGRATTPESPKLTPIIPNPNGRGPQGSVVESTSLDTTGKASGIPASAGRFKRADGLWQVSSGPR